MARLHFSGQGQLTVKGSSNRMLPRFQEPILFKLFSLQKKYTQCVVKKYSIIITNCVVIWIILLKIKNH